MNPPDAATFPRPRALARIPQLTLGVLALAATAALPAIRAQAPANGTPRAEDVAAEFRTIEEAHAKLPRDGFDPAAVVANCGAEPDKLHAWVREHTRAITYPGTLRGPLGVLLDRHGNSLDRSLLLAHLLALAGYEARIVSAPPAGLTPASPPAEAPALPAVAEADAAVRAQAEAIARELLAKTGPLPLATDTNTEPRHYWAQFEDDAGWHDLDPTLAEPGKRRAEPEGDALPFALDTRVAPGLGALAHQVTLRLAVERWQEGRLHESTLLVVPFDATRGPLAAATMTFTPVNARTRKAAQRWFTTGAELRKKLLAETAWSPVLVDGRNGGRMARMFDAAGIVGDLPTSFSGAGEVGSATRNLFGGLGGDDEAEPSTVLTALAADYLIEVPGRPVRQVRRWVFDSIGPEARRRARTEALPRPILKDADRLARGAELAARHDTLVTFASLSADVYLHRFGQRVIDTKELALQALERRLEPRAFEVLASNCSLRSLEFYAAVRDAGGSAALAQTEPQVLRRILRYVPNEDAEHLDVQVLSDLAWNRLAPVNASAAAATVVSQGVLDTLREAVIVMRAEPARPADTTAALLAEAGRQGIEIVAVRDAADPRLGPLPGAARARIADDLESGNLVVLPSQPVVLDGEPRTGWWRIDPATGHTVGAMDTGLLQDYAEYQVTHEVNGVRITHWVRKPPSRQVLEHANSLIRYRNHTSQAQWQSLLNRLQRCWDVDGYLPLLW